LASRKIRTSAGSAHRPFAPQHFAELRFGSVEFGDPPIAVDFDRRRHGRPQQQSLRGRLGEELVVRLDAKLTAGLAGKVMVPRSVTVSVAFMLAITDFSAFPAIRIYFEDVVPQTPFRPIDTGLEGCDPVTFFRKFFHMISMLQNAGDLSLLCLLVPALHNR
jgi:hypothetical protein